MAKSIGTLKAMLVLDSRGFLAGFATAEKTTKRFASTIGDSVGSAMRRTGAQLMAMTVSLRALQRMIRNIVRDFVAMREVSPAINATVEAFLALDARLREIERAAFEAIAPGLTFVFEEGVRLVNDLGSAIASLGVSWDDVAGTSLVAANLFTNSMEVVGAAIASNIAMLNQLKAALSGDTAAFALASGDLVDATGRGLAAAERNAKLISGDLTALRFPRTPFKPFTPAGGAAAPGRMSRDSLDMPFVERGTSEAMKLIMGIQRPDKGEDKLGEAVEHLKKIEAHVRPKRGEGDALHIGRLGGR